MSDLKEFLTTHKTWTVLWILVAVFWLVGFGYSCAQLSHSKIYDGRPFFAELFGPNPPRKGHHDDDDDDDGVYTEIQNRNFPGWLVCPGLPTIETIPSDVAATCTQCIFTANSSTTDCSVKIDIPAVFDSNYTNCYIFNGPMANNIVTLPTPMPNRSIVNCEFNLTNTPRARFYVFDQNWLAQKDNRWLLPDGIVQRTFPAQTRNLVEISRTKYTFTRGHKETTSFFSYQLMDGESYPRTGDSNVTLTFYYGSPSEWRYSQYPYPKVTTGFGFYSWISFLGGLSFFCYFTQVGIYALICKVMGWENDTASNYQSVA